MSQLKHKAQERVTMPGQIHKAYKVLLKILHPQVFDGDQQIPMKIIANAKGIAFLTVIKAGFMFSGTLGSGIVIARLPDGSWSGPSSIGVGGMGWGAQIGASSTDSVIILNTDAAVKAFSGNSQVKFGGNISVAVGPIGRDAEASVNAGDQGVAACYSYSHSRGFFGGISLQGAVLASRHDDNEKFYGRRVQVAEILSGQVRPPANKDFQALVQTLGQFQQSSAAQGFTPAELKSFDASTAPQAFSAPASVPPSASLGPQPGSVRPQGSASVQPGFGFPSGGGFEQAKGESQVHFQAPSAPPAPPANRPAAPLPPGWVEVKAPSGEAYYWHEGSGTTQWDRPGVPHRAPPPPPPARPSGTQEEPAGGAQSLASAADQSRLGARNGSSEEAVATVVPAQQFHFDQVAGGEVLGLDKSRLEEYLVEGDFVAKFHITRAEFNALPIWKRQSLKKEVGLW